MQPEAWQEKPLHEFTGCRSSAAARDSRQPITHTSKGTFCPARVAGTCLLILNTFFLSQDLESYVTKPYADGHPKSPLTLELAHGCLSGHREGSQVGSWVSRCNLWTSTCQRVIVCRLFYFNVGSTVLLICYRGIMNDFCRFLLLHLHCGSAVVLLFWSVVLIKIA